MRKIWAVLAILVIQPVMGSNDTLDLSGFKPYQGFGPIKQQKEWAQAIAKTEGITTLIINDCGVTDEILEILGKMPLKVLSMQDNWITDQGVKHLPASLERLDISGNSLSVACREDLKNTCPNLKQLDISGNDIAPCNNRFFEPQLMGG